MIEAPLLALVLGAPAAPVTPPQPLVEHVEVNLVQFDLLVTDKKGRPVKDLRPEEIEVYEGGELQRLAFLERSIRGRPGGASSQPLPPSSPLYGAQGPAKEADPAQPVVLPPAPARRLVFAFDTLNSKRNERKPWKDAALLWLRAAMAPDDRAGVVVFRTFPDWVQPPTTDKELVVSAVAALAMDDAPDRDRRRDMTKLVADLENLCSDPRGTKGEGRTGGDTGGPKSIASSQLRDPGCALRIAEMYAQEWDTQTLDSVNVLRALVGQLAAVPGRKMILLFSDGFVPDAGRLAFQAVTGVFGVESIDQSELTVKLHREMYQEFDRLFEAAKAADVSIFTFDTRSNTDDSFAGSLERPSMASNKALGFNPWSDLQWETRSALQSLAQETGGRSYEGKKTLEDDLFAAAESFEAIYNVGYYRAQATPAGKLKIKVRRPGVLFDLPEQVGPWSIRSDAIPLDISIGAPAPGLAAGVTLPVSVQVPYAALPLRPGGGGFGCQIGVFVQAVRPDGVVADEMLVVDTAAVTKEEHKLLAGRAYTQRVRLDVGPGSYRIVARLTDDRQSVLGERAVDLTVREGGVVPGLEASGPSAR